MAAKVQLPASFLATHDTAGLAGFPAIDVPAPAGDPVYSPAAGKLVDVHYIPWNLAKRVGGWTAYLQGVNGRTYFLTHLGSAQGGQVQAGQQIGTVAAVPRGWWDPHVHVGVHDGIYDPGSYHTSVQAPPSVTPGNSVAPVVANTPPGNPSSAPGGDLAPLILALLSHPAAAPPALAPLPGSLAAPLAPTGAPPPASAFSPFPKL